MAGTGGAGAVGVVARRVRGIITSGGVVIREIAPINTGHSRRIGAFVPAVVLEVDFLANKLPTTLTIVDDNVMTVATAGAFPHIVQIPKGAAIQNNIIAIEDGIGTFRGISRLGSLVEDHASAQIGNAACSQGNADIAHVHVGATHNAEDEQLVAGAVDHPVSVGNIEINILRVDIDQNDAIVVDIQAVGIGCAQAATAIAGHIVDKVTFNLCFGDGRFGRQSVDKSFPGGQFGEEGGKIIVFARACRQQTNRRCTIAIGEILGLGVHAVKLTFGGGGANAKIGKDQGVGRIKAAVIRSERDITRPVDALKDAIMIG